MLESYYDFYGILLDALKQFLSKKNHFKGTFSIEALMKVFF